MKTTATNTRMAVPYGIAMYTAVLSYQPRYGPDRLAGWFYDIVANAVESDNSRAYVKGYNRREWLSITVAGVRQIERLAIKRARAS